MLDKLTVDPLLGMEMFIKEFEGRGVNITDPTNPFVLLLESSVSTTTSMMNEVLTIEREFFPSLATTEEDLYVHMTDGDEDSIFATPTFTKIRIAVDLNSLLSYGIEKNNIYEAIIPKYSHIEVDGVRLTLMSDIHIYLNTQGYKYRSFVESENNIEFKDIGAITSYITVDENSAEWIVFDVYMLQVKVTMLESIITKGTDFYIKVPLEEQYYKSIVYVRDKNGNWTEINKIFNDSRFDHETPSIYIKPMDSDIIYKIPRAYIDSGMLTGKVRIVIMTTKGKLRMGLSKYSSDDYNIDINPIRPTDKHAVSAELNYQVFSDSWLEGGVNKRPMRELKKKFINRVSRRVSTPITISQLNEVAKELGLTITKAIDTITDRIFIASKDINDEVNDITIPIYSYINTVLLSAEYKDVDTITITDDYYIVKPNTLFINNNGIIKPLNRLEKDILDGLGNRKKVEYLNSNKILFTPFLYIYDNDINTINSRVYDIDRCRMDYLEILDKNKYLKQNVNIVAYFINRTETGYDLLFKLNGNEYYEKVKGETRIQLKFKLTNSDTYLYYHSEINMFKTREYFGNNVEEGYWHYIKIDSSFFINDNNQIEIKNGYSLSPIKYIDLVSSVDIIIYYPNKNVITFGDVQLNSQEFLGINSVEIQGIVNKEETIGFTKEKIVITFGDSLKYLWRAVSSSYTASRYKRWDKDIPLTYTEDDCKLVVVKNSKGICEDVYFSDEYKVGDVVKDNKGNIVYKYQLGDVIIDDTGNPIEDDMNKLLRVADIFMLEYIYKAFNKDIYLTHINSYIELFRTWVIDQLEYLNRKTVEQTLVLFRSKRSSALIKFKDITINSDIQPTVTIYLDDNIYGIKIDEKKIYDEISRILNRYFSKKYIVVQDIEEEIKNSLDLNILAVKIKDYIEGDPKVINLEEQVNRLTLKKRIDDSFNIVYDYNLNIERI